MKPKPLEMDSLIVALKRVRTYGYLSEVGYYEREKMGFGTFTDLLAEANQSAIRVQRDDQGIVLEGIVNIEDISAVEVHTRATSMPLQYGGTQETCGLLMIWTLFFTGTGG